MAEQGEELLVDEDKKSSSKLVVIIGAAMLGLGVGAAGVFFALSGSDETASDDTAVEEPVRVQSMYYRLEKPFIVNFDAKGKQRYLQVDVQIKGKDQDAFDAIKTHEPVIKNDLNNLFSNQDLSELQTDAGRVKLVEDATAAVQAFLEKETGSPGIEQVLFTNFVMQ